MYSYLIYGEKVHFALVFGNFFLTTNLNCRIFLVFVRFVVTFDLMHGIAYIVEARATMKN